MVSLRTFGFTTLAALVSSQHVASLQGDAAPITTKRQTDFFEVSSCHAHGDAIFCIYEGEEWEVASGADAGTAPDTFAGCHSHSGTEM
jgi:carbonic anhydrase/acetyltransferase-like protein (isoleucine patch superfamily)